MFPSLFWASTRRIQQFAGGWMGAVFTSCSANSLYCLHNNDVTAQGQGPQLAIHFQCFHCFTSSSMRRRRKINNRSWDFSPFFSWIDFSISSINVKTRWLYLVFSKFANSEPNSWQEIFLKLGLLFAQCRVGSLAYAPSQHRLAGKQHSLSASAIWHWLLCLYEPNLHKWTCNIFCSFCMTVKQLSVRVKWTLTLGKDKRWHKRC